MTTRHRTSFRLRSVRVPSAWSSITSASMRSRWSAIVSVASKMGCTSQTLREWVHTAERDSGHRPGVPASPTRLKALERENRELRRANEILRKATASFSQRSSTADRSDDRLHRRTPGAHGVEPICAVLPIAPSTYYAHSAGPPIRPGC